VAYLKEHRDCSIDDYIGFYREQHQKRREFLAAKNLPEDPYMASVYTTWNVSRQALEKKNLLSVALLDALAYFAAAPIPLAVLAHAGESGGNIDQALQSLMKYSLVDADTQEVRIHELVQEVLRLQQQEKASFRPPLRLALRLASSYVRLLPDISFFILHAVSVISLHDDVLPGESGEEKVQTLYKIGSCYHFDLLRSGAAVKVFEQAKAICDRTGNEPIKRKYFIDIQIGLANSWSGAASPLQYTEMLDQLLNSDDLSISHITTLMRNYGINVDLASAKAKLMELIPFLRFYVDLAPENFFAGFLTPTFKTLRVSYAPQVLAAIGAKQLAIVYLMFRGNLPEAETMAESYYNSDGHTASSMVEAISLYVEVKVLRGTLLLPVAIDLLKQAIGLLDAHPDIDRFWTDQIYFILSTIYAAEGKFAESHDTIFRLWEIMVKNMAAAGSEEGLKDRLKNLSKIVGFLEKFISPQTTSLFAQAFRLMGRLLSALKEDAEAEKCYKSSLGYEESILTHYEYGCLLFRTRSRHAEAQLCFESVIVFAMSLGQPIDYRYYFREAPTLSRRFRPLLVEETPSVQIPVHLLAYVFLALLCKKNADMEGCETWLIRFADESASFGSQVFQRLLGIIREKIAKQPKALLADVNEQPGAAPT
jgi:tetratricopeptide (TPR) repeat protein